VRYTLSITATSADIDELGHVSNQVYLRWVLDVAMAHSAARGWDHAAYRALGGIWVVRRHDIDYLAQVMLGEEVTASTWVDSWKLASYIRATELTRGGQLVARAATTWAFMAIATSRPQKIPDELRAAFEQ
jgi:acyl-CoA thioester hydrolase